MLGNGFRGKLTGMAAAGTSRIRLDVLRLVFRDPEMERCFRSSWLDATRLHNLFWKLGAIAYYLSITLVFQAHLPPQEQALNDLRFLVGLPAIVLSTVPLIFHDRLKSLSSLTYSLAVIMAFSITCLQLRNAETPNDYLFLFDLTVIFIFSQHYNRAFFLHNVLMMMFLGSFVIVSVYGFGASTLAREIPVAPFLITLAALSLIGVFASYTREYFVRRNFASVRELRQAKLTADELAEQATAALEVKSRFMAIVGHELRTPLNAIIGFSEMMLSGVIGQVRPARAADYIQDIFQSGRHLMQLVESVLDYTHTGSGMIRLMEEVVPPEKLIADVLTESEGTLSTRRQSLNVIIAEGVPDLRIDARQIRQCLANLISNASKFSPVGGEITCKALSTNDGSVHVVVIDCGSGFDEKNTELLFDPFAQADDELNRRTGGLGIGLPLTRALMQAHDGEVRISNRSGIGAEAALVFPRSRSQPASQGSQTRAA
ncbi:MAG: HAMP domain-containing sensor histidine kinase [Minwuia sp.]|nr:HAMP domain-containing sensor histidine kinase [Minwuia sp.]